MAFEHRTCIVANHSALRQDFGLVATPAQDFRVLAIVVSPLTFTPLDTVALCLRSRRLDWRLSVVHHEDTRGEQPQRLSILGESRWPLLHPDQPGLCLLLLHTYILLRHPRKLLKASQRERDRRSLFKVCFLHCYIYSLLFENI